MAIPLKAGMWVDSTTSLLLQVFWVYFRQGRHAKHIQVSLRCLHALAFSLIWATRFSDYTGFQTYLHLLHFMGMNLGQVALFC
jgi:hypothetical protein